MRKNHKIKAALFAGLAGTMLFGSCMTAYAAGVTKSNKKLYCYMNDDDALWTGWRTISGSRVITTGSSRN